MVSKEQIEHIAKLARIEITEKEGERFSNDLSSILDYIDKLNKVDTKDIKPIQQITGLETVARKDEPARQAPSTANKILKEAPDSKDKYFKVPKILE